MSNSALRKLGRPLAGSVAALALLMGVNAASASATEISLNPTEVAVNTLKPTYPSVEVSGTGFGEYIGKAGDIRIGLCTGRVFGEGMVFAPACALFAGASVNGSGVLSGTVQLVPTAPETATFANEHFELEGLPKQPATFNCVNEQNQGPKLGCNIVAVDHAANGKLLDSAALKFNP